MGILIQAKDSRVKKREPLWKKIPLSFPYLIYIEPTNCCNFHCAFCPTGDKQLLKKVNRPSGMMEMSLYRKIIDEIRDLGQRLRLLSLYKDGEPLLHPDFPEMVRYAKVNGVSDRIYVKTNGSLLTPERNSLLSDCGLDWMGISVEAVSAEKYRKITGFALDYDHFKKNIEDLYRRKKSDLHLYIKIIDVNLSEGEKQKFYQDFSAISDSYAIENLMGWSYSGIKDFTLGNPNKSFDGLPLVEKTVCPYPFYVMAINFNGTVSLCCSDWSHSTVVGDLRQESLMDVWHGERLKKFREMHLAGRRCENRACGDCFYLKTAPDNLDSEKEQLLQKLNVRQNGRKTAK